MNKKPPELPNIEDATLRACLAPLMDAMHAGGDIASVPPLPEPDAPVPRPRRGPAVSRAEWHPGSNDNPLPAAEAPGESSYSTPTTLAEWRSMADDAFGVFRMIEIFLAMTETELLAVARDFPKQIGGTVARIARLKRRLAGQYDMVTTAAVLLERALARAHVHPGENQANAFPARSSDEDL